MWCNQAEEMDPVVIAPGVDYIAKLEVPSSTFATLQRKTILVTDNAMPSKTLAMQCSTWN